MKEYIWLYAGIALPAILVIFIAIFFYRHHKGVKEPFVPEKMPVTTDSAPKPNTNSFMQTVEKITLKSTQQEVEEFSRFLISYKSPKKYFDREKAQLFRLFNDCIVFNEKIQTGTKEGLRLFLKDNIGVEGLDDKPKYVEIVKTHITEISPEKAAEIKKIYDSAVYDYSKQLPTSVNKAREAVGKMLRVLLSAAEVTDLDLIIAIDNLKKNDKISNGSCENYKKILTLCDSLVCIEEDVDFAIVQDIFFLLRKEYELFAEKYTKTSSHKK